MRFEKCFRDFRSSILEKRAAAFEIGIGRRRSFRCLPSFLARLFGAGFQGDPKIFAAERSFESVAEFDIDDFVGFLAAPNTGAGGEVFDGDEHGNFLDGDSETWFVR